jgi:hypothetical protein
VAFTFGSQSLEIWDSQGGTYFYTEAATATGRFGEKRPGTQGGVGDRMEIARFRSKRLILNVGWRPEGKALLTAAVRIYQGRNRSQMAFKRTVYSKNASFSVF